MDEISVALVNGDSGLTVTEQLQTLRVACPVGDGVSSSAVPALFLQGPDLQGSGESPTEGPAGLAEEQVAEPVRAATNGGDSVERIWQPDSPHSLLEPPELGSKGALLEGETSSSSSSSDCVWPGVSAVAAAGEASPGTGARAAEQQQEQARQEPEAPVEGEKDKASPVSCPVEDTEVLDSNSSAPRLLAFSGDVESEEVTCRLASAGPEGQAALPGGRLGKEGLAMEDSSSSSDSEADSDTDTDSSSSVSSSSSGLPMLSDEDADQPDKNENDPIKQKDELFEQKLLPVEDVNIILPEFVELMSFGKVSSVIEHLVIIESLKGLQPVNENTVLFKEDRHSIGKVFEVFGPVSHPFYVLQFNSPEHIETKGVKIHDTVYFAPSVKDFTQYIFPEKLKHSLSIDIKDLMHHGKMTKNHPLRQALEFSDDEKESAAKHQKKKSQNSRKKLRSLQEESSK
ncbi:hypothetical protein lerEdw1_012147 [Lerista edwardsae]|nr:hypothetical protein lerEdw1_012147 [Lerista edwardsae]